MKNKSRKRVEMEGKNTSKAAEKCLKEISFFAEPPLEISAALLRWHRDFEGTVKSATTPTLPLVKLPGRARK
jgi:hypothetical protein